MLLQNERYTLLRNLCKGSAGVVHLAIDNVTGGEVAVKLIERGGATSSGVLRSELVNHSALGHHPHVIALKEVFLTSSHVAIIMELGDGGDLSRFTAAQCDPAGGGMAEGLCRRLFQQLMVAVDYCHRLGIANRDIKLDNVLLATDGEGRACVKVCDFGYSKSQTECNTRCGTPEYMAPEVLLMRAIYDGRKADIWSAGVMLYTMLQGDFPFSRPEDDAVTNPVAKIQAQFSRIVRGDYVIDERYISPEAADLLRRMLVTDPAERADVAAVMGHPWFRRDLDPRLAGLNDALLADRGPRPSGVRSCATSDEDLETIAMLSCHKPRRRALPPHMHHRRIASMPTRSPSSPLGVQPLPPGVKGGGMDRVGSGALVTSAHERSAALQRPPKSPGHSAVTTQLPPWALAERPSRMMPRASSDTLLSVRQSAAA